MVTTNGNTDNPDSCPVCGRPVRVVGEPDFLGDEEACTLSYEPVPDPGQTVCPLVEECLTKAQSAALAAMREMQRGRRGGLIKLYWDGKGTWKITPHSAPLKVKEVMPRE